MIVHKDKCPLIPKTIIWELCGKPYRHPISGAKCWPVKAQIWSNEWNAWKKPWTWKLTIF